VIRGIGLRYYHSMSAAEQMARLREQIERASQY
jgi:hypothetical protein